jgi:hypothetical protein
MAVSEEHGQTPGGLSRRDVLRRGATAGAVVAWSAPMVMSMSGTAFAQTSGSPQPSVSSSATVSPTVSGTKLTRPGALPRTGSGVDVPKTVALGTGLVATGATVEIVRRYRGAGKTEPKHI